MHFIEESLRLDHYLSEKHGITRSQAQKWIENGFVKVNSEAPKKAGLILKKSDHVGVKVPTESSSKLQAMERSLEIIYEDKELLVLNKEAGQVVHPSSTDSKAGSVIQAALAYLKSLPEDQSSLRPGVVHRLDKDTSGVLLIAKTLKMQQDLMEAFSGRTVKKIYWALVKGCPKNSEGSILSAVKRDSKQRQRMAIHAQGKKAVSHFKVLQRFKEVSLLEVQIETGRTHQIRLHLASIGHPVMGDKVYGDAKMNKKFMQRFNLKRQFLHAKELSVFKHHFVAELKADLEAVLKQLS